MVNVVVLCDERFDPNLTYQIHGEKVASEKTGCEICSRYSECQGWAKEFGKCKEENTDGY